MQHVEPSENHVLRQIHEGMHVRDARGRDLGKVSYVKMGDPEAATTQGNDRQPGPLGQIAYAVVGEQTEPDVPEPFRSQLLRSGFFKVDGPGLFGTDRYVAPDQVARITETTISLSVTRDHLVQEA